ncbi:hypothetical protein ESA_03908 [Cronobacter sakazakii ATCC BAA-894]|uniref:Uncharacterized protein n=1 Tax=Cronobacter sakazakii (strain ATCC BAA-894) TaxID=290339 RepID=A7MQ39_CROS8|nr:hypothetical protein ESA_03908 [Cronobacter sakazakii ATCC BAA-894]
MTLSIKIVRESSEFIPTINPYSQWNQISLYIQNNGGFSMSHLLVYLHSKRVAFV